MKSLAEIPVDKIYIGMSVRFIPEGDSGTIVDIIWDSCGKPVLKINFGDGHIICSKHTHVTDMCLDPTRM